MSEENRTAPPEVDATTPSAARLYDYYLGGKNHYAADRELGDRLLAEVPELGDMARANRAFLGRAVTHLAGLGIDQFIDIGAGLPTADNTHQIARRTAPGARVLYIDPDPVVRAHAGALLVAEDPAATAVIDGDITRPEHLLAQAAGTGLIDFDRPVGLLLVALLHFVTDDREPYWAVQTLLEALPPGSALVLSHVERDTAPGRAAHLERLYEHTSSPGQTRTREEIQAFFDGLALVEPGLVHVAAWRPHLGHVQHPPERAWVYAGVGLVEGGAP